ncbi:MULTISPECIES: DUF397 domain-containing protein [Streptomyces]|uniref:DUF397 domain-containing protein n=1 Tax=Streptomyces TaxID=1883 RepID=UPI0004C69909|nr:MULTISPECIES: DUF397 domain-containing protein [unclassified Streptomyces]KPC82789.1 hypothetical protein ADK82_09260 [Streptomyces sp. NRRL S-4]
MTTTPEPSTAAWRKASYSNGDGGECLEVADGFPGLVPVRDSKTPDGPTLAFRAAHWTHFVEALRAGSL